MAGNVIGKGAFGTVVRATAIGIGSSRRSTVVAVKTLRGRHVSTNIIYYDLMKTYMFNCLTAVHSGRPNIFILKDIEKQDK